MRAGKVAELAGRTCGLIEVAIERAQLSADEQALLCATIAAHMERICPDQLRAMFPAAVRAAAATLGRLDD